ncbi:hypothetical protein [Ottowia beijingensis]|uniref:hypothetical protein n=1 Tax=Ottowia beijingensis TaxID=1207057 RepID=UPI002FD99C37
MKLVKHIKAKIDDQDNGLTVTEKIMTSDNIDELKLRANELSQLEGLEPSAWTSRYPVMGSNSIEAAIEWVMILENGTTFSIET